VSRAHRSAKRCHKRVYARLRRAMADPGPRFLGSQPGPRVCGAPLGSLALHRARGTVARAECIAGPSHRL